MKHLLALSTSLALCLALPPAFGAKDDDEEPASAKEALQHFHEYIGNWEKGIGGPDGKKQPAANEVWKEDMEWGWKFKGDDAWLIVKFKDGRYFKKGELKYLMDKKVYQFTVTDKKDKELVFKGKFANDFLTLDRLDPATKETQRITMNTTGEGARFIYRYSVKPEGRTVFQKGYMVALSKEGESLGKTEKKNICVVSGGVGTTAVSFGGKTYYICCSGCADAFRENPEKYVKEFEAKQKKK